MADEAKARQVAEFRQSKQRETELVKSSKVSLDDLYSQIKAGDVKELRVVLKADVQGSVEAVSDALTRMSTGQAAKEAASDASFKASQAKQQAQAAVASDEEETFDAAFKRKQAEAQAAIFGSGGPAPAPKPAEPEGAPAWVCPEHKTSVTKTSPKGRIYLACPTCGNFQ